MCIRQTRAEYRVHHQTTYYCNEIKNLIHSQQYYKHPQLTTMSIVAVMLQYYRDKFTYLSERMNEVASSIKSSGELNAHGRVEV